MDSTVGTTQVKFTDHQESLRERRGHSEEKSKSQPKSDYPTHSTALANSTQSTPQSITTFSSTISTNPKPIYARILVPGMINAPLRRINPPLPPSSSSVVPAVMMVSERQMEKRPVAAPSKTVVDLTLVDSDDDIVILSEAKGGPSRRPILAESKKKRSAEGGERESSKGKERAKKQEQEKQVIPAAKASRRKSPVDEPIAGPSRAKKSKRTSTLAELIKARKADKAGRFATLEDYENYLSTAPTPSNLVFSSCRIVLLNYTPDSNSSISKYAMARAEQIASKGGRLIPASKFIPSPPSIDPADNWVRPPAGLATEEERSLLQRAEKEGWVTHIVILDPRTPSSHDPAPATFDNVLAQLGPNGMTRESLGAFCKIVNTDWISASGDKMEPVSELGNELFNDERGGRVAVDEDSKKRVALQADWDNQREIARKLGMYLRMNGDEDSEGEEPDTPNVYVAPAATKLFQGGLSKRLEIARAMESRRGSYVDSLTCEGRWPAAVCAEQLENWKERMKGAGLGWFLMSGQFDAP